jgi:hypothetical protein
LATQDGELVAEHDDLQLFGRIGAKAQDGNLQDTSKRHITQRDEHDTSSTSD